VYNVRTLFYYIKGSQKIGKVSQNCLAHNTTKP
jgi:hypothetical protein